MSPNDDIVARIRQQAYAGYIDEHYDMLLLAADEIERLRKAGDAIAATGGQHGFDDALDNWKEMRGE